LTKEDLPVTKLNELDATDLSEMFEDLDDEYEDCGETDDNEPEVESHNELVYF
jgi:hypothetical protein